MKFSCVMTAFNEGPLIAQSVTSILNQSHEDLELVIVDDGAGADTKSALQEITDPRVQIIEQSNDGVSSARNRGLRHCRGDYVCFLDADDVRAPWAFAEVAAEIEARDSPELILVRGILSTLENPLEPFMDDPCVDQVDAETARAGGTLGLADAKAWAASFEPQPANKFIARALIERAHLCFPNDHFFEDILFHTLVVAHARSVRFLNSRSFTYFQRQMRPQTTGSNSEIRFDIIGTAMVTFQLLAALPDFANQRLCGAVAISTLRLLHWCEQSISIDHRHSYRVAVGHALRQVPPRFWTFPEDAPDPRGERQMLRDFARRHIMA